MPVPTLWLAITTVLVAVLFLVFFTLLLSGFGTRGTPPPTIEEQYLASLDSPWSFFKVNGECQTWLLVDGVQTNQFNPPCTPSGAVSKISIYRTCEREGCIDLNGNPRPIGYTEYSDQDCSLATNCNLSTQTCFNANRSCADRGITTTQIKTLNSGICLTWPFVGESDVTIQTCFGIDDPVAYKQRWNFIPSELSAFGQAYNITTVYDGSCLIPDETQTTTSGLETGLCEGGWFWIPETTVQYPVPGTTSTVPATIVNQLVYIPDLSDLPSTFPVTYTQWLELSTKVRTLSGDSVIPFPSVCSDDNAGGLPTCSGYTSITPQAFL